MNLHVKKLFLFFFLAVTAVVLPKKALSTHLVGSDISYTCLGGNTYQISLTFYRDCQGSLAPLGVGIEFRSASCNQYFTDTLLLVSGTGNEITYPCPTTVTSCTDPLSNIPGIQEYRYTGIVTLPARCTDWIISWSYCCRNCDITTMQTAQPCVEGANPGMYVAATLDNLFFDCNSSPTFTNNPIAFVCIGQNFTYNHGVIDPDGDSLVYSLVNPMRNATDSIPFITGYSATNPITSSPALTINTSNGDLQMTPTQQEVGVLSVLVQEYRDGMIIGSVVRDMAIYVRPCTNNLPFATGINGTNVRDTAICPGTALCFDIYSGDSDSTQIVTMSWNQSIPGATFSVSGSPHPVGTFCWTPGFSDIRPNPYPFTVTVLDDACPNAGYQTYSFNILVNSPLYSLQATNISCNGLTDGSAVVVPGGGTLSYSWQPGGQTTASISGLSAGSYIVTVTDSLTGCIAVDTAVIIDPPVLTSSVTSTNPVCGGVSDGTAVASAAGGTPSYTFSWNTVPPTLNDSVSSLAPGNYQVTVTDSRGCTSISSVTIASVNPPVEINVDSVNNLLCAGGATGYASVQLSGGVPAYDIGWYLLPDTITVVGTSAFISGADAGTYLVVVTDSVGCTETDSITLTEPPALQLTGSSTSSTCNNSDGTATVTVSGGTPGAGYQYLWSPGNATTSSISGLAAAVYTVTVTDANNCTSSLAIPVSDSNIPAPLINYISLISCPGQSDASVVAVPQGGTGPFTYAWNTNPVQTNDTAFNLSAGVYSVSLTDINGCQSFNTITISDPSPISASIFSSNTNCFGDSSGAAAVVFIGGGLPPYTYQWSPLGGNGPVAAGLPAGLYSLVITDSSGCSETYSNIDIGSAAQITVTVDSTLQPTCYGSTDGYIAISAGGGTGNLSYFWNPGGSSAQDLIGIDAGIYNLTITDVNGCSYTQSIPLGQPPPVVAYAGEDTSYCSGNAVQLNASLSATQTGVWTSSAGSQVTFSNVTDPNAIVSNLGSGFNQLTWTVTDANGCTASDDVIIFNYGNIVASAGPDTSFCGLATLLLNGNEINGYNGVWTSNLGNSILDPGSGSTSVNLTVFGVDTLRWTLSNSVCSTTDFLLAGAYQAVVADVMPDDVSCAPNGVLIAIVTTPGTGIWTSLTSGSTVIVDRFNDTTAVQGLAGGENVFLWTITNGPCVDTATVRLAYDNKCELDLPTAFSPNGDGFNDGYEIKGIDGYPDNVFRVFNRWGNEVYNKDDYVNTDWTGQNNSGQQLPDGTYFVVLSIVDRDIRKSTFVDLRRVK